MTQKKEIRRTGFYLFGALTLLIIFAKLAGLISWSWWRALLPISIFVGFNVIYIVVGFIYLTFASIPERTQGDEAAIMAPYEFGVHHIASMLFFIVFADNAVRWLEADNNAYWFWLCSGKSQAVLIFAGLSVAAQFWYWSTLGRALKNA